MFAVECVVYKKRRPSFLSVSLISLVVSVDVKHHVYLLLSVFGDLRFGSGIEGV